MSHTATPWNLDEEIWSIDDDAHNPAQICSVSPRPERRANALLIAAAPDLLAALKRAVWALDDCDTFGDCLLDDHLKALAEAKAAIAAAEGQQ